VTDHAGLTTYGYTTPETNVERLRIIFLDALNAVGGDDDELDGEQSTLSDLTYNQFISSLVGATHIPYLTTKDIFNQRDLTWLLQTCLDITGSITPTAGIIPYVIPRNYIIVPVVAPVITELLKRVFLKNADSINLFTRYIGYCAFNTHREQKALLCMGQRGANGKGALSNLVQQLFGADNCVNLQLDGNTFQFSKSEGKLIGIINEVSTTDITGQTFKELVTESYMSYEHKNGKPHDNFNITKLFMFSNQHLSINGQDNAIPVARRLLILPCVAHFSIDNITDDWTTGELTADTTLTTRQYTADELDNFMSYCINEYIANGLSDTAATIEQRAEFISQNNTVKLWIEDEDLTAESFVGTTKKDMYHEYTAWAKSYGYRCKNVTNWLTTVLDSFKRDGLVYKKSNARDENHNKHLFMMK
jgi:P4 family phage/plasmid primase-like protien